MEAQTRPGCLLAGAVVYRQGAKGLIPPLKKKKKKKGKGKRKKEVKRGKVEVQQVDLLYASVERSPLLGPGPIGGALLAFVA